MKKLIDVTFRQFYKTNEFVASTSPMRTHYASKNPIERFIWQSKLAAMHKILDVLPYKNVLDIGCGDGGLLQTIRPEADYMGIDISPTQLAYFQKYMNSIKKKRKGNITIKQGDVTKLPLIGDSFDLVLACDVLEHLLDPKATLIQIKNVLKPGAFALISIPNEPIWQLLRFASGRWPPRSPDHIYFIEEKDIVEVFPKIISRTFLPVPIPPFHLIEMLVVQKNK